MLITAAIATCGGFAGTGRTITSGLVSDLDPSLTNVSLFRGNGTVGDFDDISISTPEPGFGDDRHRLAGLGIASPTPAPPCDQVADLFRSLVSYLRR